MRIFGYQNDPHVQQLKARFVPENRRIVLLREHEGRLKMLDGSHRFLSMVMNDVSRVIAYVAVSADKKAKPIVGDAIFLRLRRMWQQTDNESFKESIERTVIGMMHESSDGEQAVKSYWVSMAPNEEVRAVGQKMLESFRVGNR